MGITSRQLNANHNHAARLATAAALPANTYYDDLGTGTGTSGQGSHLIANSNGALSVDGVAVAVRDVILVKDEGTPAHNGLYIVAAAGDVGSPWEMNRHPNMATAYTFTGALIPVCQEGTANKNTLWLCNWYAGGVVTVGTTNIVFAQL